MEFLIKLFKKISPWIIKELTVCINKSFREECFPEKLKVSQLSPVFKKGDRTCPSNWRPIAQLSPFSKAYEKTFLNQLNEQSDFNKVINSNQFGFRSKHSTVHPCILIKNYIEMETQKIDYVVMIALDIKKRHLTVLKQMVYYKIKLNIIQKVMVSQNGLTHITPIENNLQNGVQLNLKQLIIIK